MNRLMLDICKEWEADAKTRWIGPDDSRSKHRFFGLVSGVAEIGPDETDVLLDSFNLSDETVTAFRRGEPEKFMRHLFLDALDRKLNRIRRESKKELDID